MRAPGTHAAVLALALVLALTQSRCGGDGAGTPTEYDQRGDFSSMSPYECSQAYPEALTQPVFDAGALPYECQEYFSRLQQGPCHDAIAQVCGEFGRCEGLIACVAVRLMAENVDALNLCQGALNDTTTYPPCDAADDCDNLVARVCGGGPGAFQPCATAPACQAAQLLEAESRADLEVVKVCSQNLQESSLYPRCTP